MTPENFKVIIITPEKYITGEAGLINALFEAGLQVLHIRKPSYHMEGARNLINSISKDFHSRIVLHSHYELLGDFNLKGAHLPEKIRTGVNITGIKKVVSSSFHRVEDIIKEKMNFEYVFFSPVFQSISKEGHGPSSRVQKMKDYLKSGKKDFHFPVVALGGITDKNLPEAREIGFGGVACLGYIWENPDPVDQFKNLLKIV